MYQWILTAAIMLAYALGIEAQGVMTTDAMIRVAEQDTKMESRALDRNNKLSTQQPVLTFVVKVDDEKAVRDSNKRLLVQPNRSHSHSPLRQPRLHDREPANLRLRAHTC